jgi:hypothetical protein
MKERGARDRHRYVVDGVVTKFVGRYKAEGKASLDRRTRGTAAAVWREERWIDRVETGRNGKYV